MSHLRRAARVDSNQAQVVSALRAAGAYVYIAGKPVDLIVQYPPKYAPNLFLMEVKDGDKPKSARKLTKAQQEFIEAGWAVTIVNSSEEALRAIGAVHG